MTTIMRGWVGRLYPNRKTEERLHQQSTQRMATQRAIGQPQRRIVYSLLLYQHGLRASDWQLTHRCENLRVTLDWPRVGLLLRLIIIERRGFPAWRAGLL